MVFMSVGLSHACSISKASLTAINVGWQPRDSLTMKYLAEWGHPNRGAKYTWDKKNCSSQLIWLLK